MMAMYRSGDEEEGLRIQIHRVYLSIVSDWRIFKVIEFTCGIGMRDNANGFGGGFRGRGGPRVGSNFGQGFVPQGEWRRGERLPDGPSGGRGRGYGGGFGSGRGRY